MREDGLDEGRRLMDEWGDETGWMEPWLLAPMFEDGLRKFCRKCGAGTVVGRRLRATFDDRGQREREMRTRCPNRRPFSGHHDSGWLPAIYVGTRPTPPPQPPHPPGRA